MTFNEYQRGVMRTASDVTKATKENMLMNGILGTAGEAGELVDLLKKQIFQGHPFDREHLIKECGDVLYYNDSAQKTPAVRKNVRGMNAPITNNATIIPTGFSSGIVGFSWPDVLQNAVIRCIALLFQEKHFR